MPWFFKMNWLHRDKELKTKTKIQLWTRYLKVKSNLTFLKTLTAHFRWSSCPGSHLLNFKLDSKSRCILWSISQIIMKLRRGYPSMRCLLQAISRATLSWLTRHKMNNIQFYLPSGLRYLMLKYRSLKQQTVSHCTRKKSMQPKIKVMITLIIKQGILSRFSHAFREWFREASYTILNGLTFRRPFKRS